MGGSLGQGTIVHGHYDIDLVLYSTSKLSKISSSRMERYVAAMHLHAGLLPCTRDPVENGYDDILDRLSEYLSEHLKMYVFLGKTKVALKFTMGELDVDLLLSPLWGNQDELFAYLRTVNPPKERLM